MADQNTDGDWAFTIAPIYKPKGGPTEPGDGSDTIRVTPIWKKRKPHRKQRRGRCSIRQPASAPCDFQLWRFLQRRNLRAFCLRVRGVVSRSIGQAFAFDALDRFSRAHLVVDTKRHALVVAEIELAEIPLKVLRTDVVIGADDAPF